MHYVNAGFEFPIPSECTVPGTMFMNFLDFSPAQGQSWRSPQILESKVYVNAADGWDTEGFYRIEKLGPRDWLVHHVTTDGVLDHRVGLAKTRTAAFSWAASDLRNRLAKKEN